MQCSALLYSACSACTMYAVEFNVHYGIQRTVQVQFSTYINSGHSFLHTDTTIQLNLTSNTTHLPNIAPYNTFFLTCTATVPQGVVLPKSFAWTWKIGSSTTSLTRLTDNGDSILINSTNLDQPASTSVLTVRETTAGDYCYRCRVHLSGLPVSNKTDVYPINVTGEKCFRI